MESEQAKEMVERDQLWASLRELRVIIEQFANGSPIETAQDRQIIVLLARIVVAEMDYRERNLDPE